MPSRFEEALNECLDSLLRGGSVESCLDRYPEHAKELEPLLRIAQVGITSAADPNPELKSETRRSLHLSSQDPQEASHLEDALSHCIDMLLEGYPVQKSLDLYPQYSHALSPLVQITGSLRQAFAVEARADFRESARQRVLSTMASRKSRRYWPKLFTPRFTYRWAAALSTLIVIVIIGAGTFRASSDAVPGDLLYPVKELSEKVDLMLTTSSSKEAKLHTKLAKRRAEEMATVVETGDYDKIGKLSEELGDHLQKASTIVRKQQRDAAIKIVFEETAERSSEGLNLEELRELRQVLDRDTRANDFMFKEVLASLPSDMRSDIEEEFRETIESYSKAIKALEFEQPIDDLSLLEGRGLVLHR